MIRKLAMIALAAIPCATQAASDLTVLPQGRYSCWRSGSAVGPAVDADPARSFTVIRGSSYVADSGMGTYLLAGDILTFTRGPFRDTRLTRTKEGFWQQRASDGSMAAMKCSRTGPAPLDAEAPIGGPSATSPSGSGKG